MTPISPQRPYKKLLSKQDSFHHPQMFRIDCKFEAWPWIDEHRYSCNIKRKTIPDSKNLILDGRHLVPHTNYDVTGVNFMKCRITKIPASLMIKSFPFLQALSLSNCGIKEIKREDFYGLHDLRVLWVDENELEFLPGDLFVDMKKLEFVSFEKNKIRFIDAELLNPLRNLKLVNFFGNVGIDRVYNSIFLTQGNASLEEIKQEIAEKCKPPFKENPKKLEENEELQQKFKSKEAECEQLKENLEDMKVVAASLHDEIERMQKEAEKLKIFDEIQKLFKDDEFKDLTVLAKGEKFKVHKIIMAARSPTISRMLRNRSDVESLTFTDIPVSAFREVLRFMYENSMPPDDANFSDIFAAANKLEVIELKEYSVTKLINKIDEENAVEMLGIANKFQHDDLREKAFEEVQKIFPGRELKPEMAMDVAKIKKLIEAKKKYEEEFENI